MSGCTEIRSDSDGTSPTTEQPPRKTAAPDDRESEKQASPHEFVRVERVQDRTRIETADSNETAHLEDLEADRRRTFLKALEKERVAADGWSFYNGSRPTYVRYNGAWYRVIVGVH